MSRADRQNQRRRRHSRRGTTAETSILRPSERQTLDLIANGHTYATAALAQHVSSDTIKDNLTACRDRLGAKTNPHAVRLAIRTGQLEP